MGMTPERRANRRRYDAKRSSSSEARRLYKTRAWRVGRLLHPPSNPVSVSARMADIVRVLCRAADARMIYPFATAGSSA